MSNEVTPDNAGTMDRRTLMKRTGIAAAVIGGSAAVLAAPAAAKGGKSIVLDVDTDGFADFQQVDNGGGSGPFYVSGAILTPGTATNIGTFHCWGWIRSGDGLGVVNQEFEIDGRGKIQISGVESDAPRAVSGGTDDFQGAGGQGVPDLEMFDFPNSGKFRIAFNLTSASGAPIT